MNLCNLRNILKLFIPCEIFKLYGGKWNLVGRFFRYVQISYWLCGKWLRQYLGNLGNVRNLWETHARSPSRGQQLFGKKKKVFFSAKIKEGSIIFKRKMGGEDNFLREKRGPGLFSILKEAQTFLCFTKRGRIISLNVSPRFGFSKLSLFGENFHTTARNVCLSSVSLCLCLSIQPFLQLSVSDSVCLSVYQFVRLVIHTVTTSFDFSFSLHLSIYIHFSRCYWS